MALHRYNYPNLWDYQNFELPQRSHLYPLKPLGLGTHSVESLISYVTRLAAFHQVPTGVLLAQEIAPRMSKYRSEEKLRLNAIFFRTFFNQTLAWNGTGVMAIELISILQKLIKQPTLKFLTLVPWSSVLPKKQLLHKYRSWCPLCLHEYEKSGIPIYEPLLWSISPITVCLKHKQPLLNQCPHCQRRTYSFSWNSKPGFCGQCQQWLGGSYSVNKPDLITQDNLEWQGFVCEQVGEILAAAPYLIEPPQKEKLHSTIDSCIKESTGGSSKAFAAQMYLSPTVPRDWRVGNALPQLKLLLRVCWRLSISLLDVLTANVTITQPLILKDLPLSEQYRKTNRPLDLGKIQEFLEQALSFSPPQTVEQIADEIKYDRTDLYRYFPDLCRQISGRYKLYKKSSSS